MEEKAKIIKEVEKMKKDFIAWFDERFKLMEESLALTKEEAKLSAKKKAKKS